MPRVEEQVGNRRRPDDRRAVWRHWTQSAPEIRGRLIVGGAGKQVVQRMAQRALAPCRERAVESRQFRSEERRVGKECVRSVDHGGRRIIKQNSKTIREIPQSNNPTKK